MDDDGLDLEDILEGELMAQLGGDFVPPNPGEDGTNVQPQGEPVDALNSEVAVEVFCELTADIISSKVQTEQWRHFEVDEDETWVYGTGKRFDDLPESLQTCCEWRKSEVWADTQDKQITVFNHWHLVHEFDFTRFGGSRQVLLTRNSIGLLGIFTGKTKNHARDLQCLIWSISHTANKGEICSWQIVCFPHFEGSDDLYYVMYCKHADHRLFQWPRFETNLDVFLVNEYDFNEEGQLDDSMLRRVMVVPVIVPQPQVHPLDTLLPMSIKESTNYSNLYCKSYENWEEDYENLRSMFGVVFDICVHSLQFMQVAKTVAEEEFFDVFFIERTTKKTALATHGNFRRNVDLTDGNASITDITTFQSSMAAFFEHAKEKGCTIKEKTLRWADSVQQFYNCGKLYAHVELQDVLGHKIPYYGFHKDRTSLAIALQNQSMEVLTVTYPQWFVFWKNHAILCWKNLIFVPCSNTAEIQIHLERIWQLSMDDFTADGQQQLTEWNDKTTQGLIFIYPNQWTNLLHSCENQAPL